MFGINSQYLMSVSIGKYEDFLKDDKFISFIIIDNIGLSIPYWELKFDCVIPEMLKLFNEKQTISISLGKDINNLQNFTLIIKKPIIVPKSVSSYEITLRGFSNMTEFLENENIYQSDKEISTSELMRIFANKYGLRYQSNTNTNDKMIYMQPCVTDYKFLFTEWLHSYTENNDIIIPAISMSNKLKYNSLKQMIRDFDAEKSITFTDINPIKKQLQVDSDQISVSNTTISNSFGNYVKDRYIYDIDNGKEIHVNVDNDIPIISESKTTSVRDNISKSSGFYIQSSNVHNNYYKQELINTQKWFSIQSSRQWVSVPNLFISDLEPGDLTMYMTKKVNKQVNDQLSGLYLVNKRVLSIKERTIKTNFLLSRENMNYSR